MLEVNAGLEAKTVFEYLQRRDPGQFADGQLRTLQRRVKSWRATEGPAREVFFAQQHLPGRLGASDFTHMEELGVTLQGQSFPHLIYHFVLTYSNWEAGTVCYSESFESLCEGLQNAIWELGKVPQRHRTDRLSTAVNNASDPAEFTERYQGLLRYYGLEGEKTQAGHGNENGDVEQRHHRFKRAVGQELLLRGSRDFASVAEYQQFLQGLFERLNAGRKPTAGGRDEGDAGVAGTAHGVLQAGASEGGLGQSDLRRSECVLGAQPVDRRAGGSATVPGPGRSLVRPEEGGAAAAVAGAAEASGGLPPHHRLVSAQARGLRALPLPG